MPLKYQIPTLLVYSRLLLGFLIVVVTLLRPNFYPLYTVVFLTLGLMSDIFDGIIARHLGVSDEKLRRLDSNIDQIFFICAIASIYLQQPVFFKQYIWPILVLVLFEVAIYTVSFIKFRKEVATHSLGAKIWTLFLFSLLVQVTLTGQSQILFWIVFWLGLLTRAEIIAIILVLEQWQNDVPSLKQALRIRKGLAVQNNRFFNG
ncbi:CDP-alcohol phosphatidyltransferase family protein [Acinetobacter genomosp. 15BJ]|uniref:CDP-alcohol phosphatidyltransferase family protein n=1 Tax=Acinetobacter genomosp. 15BJ TaxID=106651 RepID=A0ABT8V186_9GAMM|nr:CDP-alcohol phosphatidyltransferase family protein [Acinetobacter genomosp. 15BJ]MDO3658203.1 CDP-alcohol phosphatidyltransferase family protein [Acinetobacter genomosp. 15BJ]